MDEFEKLAGIDSERHIRVLELLSMHGLQE
jgi:hypothetical protein